MIKHLYFHSSNLKYLKNIRDDERFEGVHEYSSHEIELASRNEYGRIRTQKNEYHFLFGEIRQENCPWCNGDVELVEVNRNELTMRSCHCVEYCKCGSRGPLFNRYIPLKKSTMKFLNLL